MCNGHLICPLGTFWLAHGPKIAVFLRFGLCKQRRAKTTAPNHTKSSSLYSSQHVDVQRTPYLLIGYILTCPRAQNCCFFLRFGLCKQCRLKTIALNHSKWSSLFLSQHVDVQQTPLLPIGYILTCPRVQSCCFFFCVLDLVNIIEQTLPLWIIPNQVHCILLNM